ncbi:hypothetical protein ACP4OV_021043 [Aristida adscensionis]
MGRGKRSVLASLFGFRTKHGHDEEEAAATATATAGRAPPQRYYNYNQGRRVRPSDDDEYYGRHWYAERDIDRKAADYIQRVRMLAAGDQDG